ncbi:MAG: hypothetical protein ABI480_18685, partial [Chitinophagaceae bacterium]
GLWHGAGWTFIIWGLLHALATSYEFITRKFRKKMSKKIPSIIYNPLSVILTFAFMLFAWVFFRANRVHDAFTILRNSTKNFGSTLSALSDQFYYYLLIIVFLLIEYVWRTKDDIMVRLSQNTIMRKSVRISYYSLLFWLIVVWGVFGKKSFIYFQF